MFESIELQGKDREWAEAHFKPIVPFPNLLQTFVDLEGLAVAQREYRSVQQMIADTLPYDEWLQHKPDWMDRNNYWKWVDGLQDMVRTLEREYAVELLMAPSLEEQQERPQ
ncbi:MAG: hypothetical protein SGI92_15020 [Bryobacteraceae bacterium]|nr:hypothetical protein [Bryobacteraceae bacterium]